LNIIACMYIYCIQHIAHTSGRPAVRVGTRRSSFIGRDSAAGVCISNHTPTAAHHRFSQRAARRCRDGGWRPAWDAHVRSQYFSVLTLPCTATPESASHSPSPF
jgi:hypothetical protein